MLSPLVIAYLFCGGAGAGAIFLVAVLELMLLRIQLGYSNTYEQSGNALLRVISWVYLLGLLLVLFGVACLVLDLGRIDRIELLFISPSLAWLSVGSFALAVLILTASILTTRFFITVSITMRVEQAMRLVAAAAAFIVMLYTGLLLSSLYTIAFWASWLLPVLFVLSALSCGCSLFFCVSYMCELNAYLGEVVSWITTADGVIIILELLAAFSYVVSELLSSREAAQSAAVSIFAGGNVELSILWWCGFIICGGIAPMLLGIWMRHTRLTAPYIYRQMSALMAVLVLVGALSMRIGIVSAGQHPEMSYAGTQENLTLEIGETI